MRYVKITVSHAMQKTIIALDPGIGGAIAVLYHNGDISAMPYVIAGKQIDWVDLGQVIKEVNPSLAVIEKVGAMPDQGVTSMFSFGQAYGGLLGMCAAFEIPVELVAPQRWKARVLAGTRKDKDAAIAYCRRVFPHVNLIPPRCRKPHDGMADALCMLEFARREFRGEMGAEPCPF